MIFEHSHDDTYSSHEIILAFGIFIPDCHHKTLPLNLTDVHLMNVYCFILNNSFSYFKIFYLEIKCFIEVWFNVLAKHISLFVFPLKIALLCYFIKKVDSGIWVLTSLAKKFSFTQVNIEAACPIVNLKTRTMTKNYMIWCHLYSKSSW